MNAMATTIGDEGPASVDGPLLQLLRQRTVRSNVLKAIIDHLYECPDRVRAARAFAVP
jgi:hypothetical protein